MTLATSMSDNLSVKVLRSVADLEAIRQVWESAKTYPHVASDLRRCRGLVSYWQHSQS
jgi:hypothetical protein